MTMLFSRIEVMVSTEYEMIRAGERSGYYEMPRGLIAVWGREAVQFLDGMITNDMKTLADGGEMLAAFPNAQGRLLAVVRVARQGDRFLLETEEATREKVYQNLFRFTLAGDFFVEDLSDSYRYFELFGFTPSVTAGGVTFGGTGRIGHFSARDNDAFTNVIEKTGAVAISDEVYETLRIENGVPLYGIDADETTIVPELGLNGLISYSKGCYIGQEVIARIHFRGHVAKRLTGLTLDAVPQSNPEARTGEIIAADGKNAGRVTSVTYSPKLDKTIVLAYVRYDYLTAGTELIVGDSKATVTDLPFV